MWVSSELKQDCPTADKTTVLIVSNTQLLWGSLSPITLCILWKDFSVSSQTLITERRLHKTSSDFQMHEGSCMLPYIGLAALLFSARWQSAHVILLLPHRPNIFKLSMSKMAVSMQMTVAALRTTVSICRLNVPGLSVVTYVWSARSGTIDDNCFWSDVDDVPWTDDDNCSAMLPVPPSTL